ncbi:DUF6233 domain-containing protein [Streptomyces sp. NPDC056921]|uniref:DUF6233 domain-containing protein n=1 Tax=Streptomyces sp. NPDC056921 TaxID=3345966 RepID=UPI0036263BBF
MSGPGGISDLDKNRALVERLEWQLRKARNRVRELEVKQEQERRRLEQAHAALRWKIQPQRSLSATLVHCGDCALYPVEGGFLTREEAVIALAEPDIRARRIRSVEFPTKVALVQAVPVLPDGPGLVVAGVGMVN